jgi:hypothetical protein
MHGASYRIFACPRFHPPPQMRTATRWSSRADKILYVFSRSACHARALSSARDGAG